MGMSRGRPSTDDAAADTRRAAGSRLADGALVGLVVVAGLVMLAVTPSTASYRDADAGAAILVVACAVPLWWWRRAPRTVLLLACAVVVANAAIGYQVGVVQYPVWIALYAAMARLPRPDRLRAVASVIVTVGVFVLVDRGEIDVLVMFGIALAFVVSVLLGEGARGRRELAVSQRAALELQRREQDAAMERLALQERACLARDLHDSVGHAINVMVLQAGVGRHVFDDRPEFARDALEHVENLGRVALGDLDAVLQLLRPADAGGDADGTSHDVSELEALCDRIRATGRPVDLHIDPIELSAGTQRAAFHIVQEALTNAARHTDAGRIDVSLVASKSDTVVTIHNQGIGIPDPLPGRGLVNMRERALLVGGRLEYGPVPDGFRVRATLPVGGVART